MWNQLGSGKSRGLGWLATDRGSRLCQVLWPGVIRVYTAVSHPEPCLGPRDHAQAVGLLRQPFWVHSRPRHLLLGS